MDPVLGLGNDLCRAKVAAGGRRHVTGSLGVVLGWAVLFTSTKVAGDAGASPTQGWHRRLGACMAHLPGVHFHRDSRPASLQGDALELDMAPCSYSSFRRNSHLPWSKDPLLAGVAEDAYLSAFLMS